MSAGVVMFSVGAAELALDVVCIHEVVRVGVIAPIPRAARRARGLARVRGRLVPIVDTAVALGLPSTPVGAESRIVLVARGARLVGLLVDRIAGMRRVTDDAPAPELLDLDRLLGGA